MLLRELETMTRRRLELGGSTSLAWSTHSQQQTAFDRRIRLLQEELDKRSREEEILTINQYASASNNPFFLGREGRTQPTEASAFYTLRPREESVIRAVMDHQMDRRNGQTVS